MPKTDPNSDELDAILERYFGLRLNSTPNAHADAKQAIRAKYISREEHERILKEVRDEYS